ncbi:hypothetical protein [Nonomuraea sp. CA-141351]|uniref:hypothetical protein n=1 Tax=Nonomuraea sp. CA-141351 TaxID=3239996 RepID=UPI003D8B15F3
MSPAPGRQSFASRGDQVGGRWPPGRHPAGQGAGRSPGDSRSRRAPFPRAAYADRQGRAPAGQPGDIITGRLTGPAKDRSADTNPTTKVEARYGPSQWPREGDEIVVRHTLRDIDGPMYVRVRGTNTDEPEPQPDPHRSDPWADLWFYSKPVFIER